MLHRSDCTVDSCTVRRVAAPRPADNPHLPAPSSAAEELVIAIRFKPRHAHVRRHAKALQHLSRSGMDAPQLAFAALPGGVPELARDPGQSGDEAVGLDGAENGSGL